MTNWNLITCEDCGHNGYSKHQHPIGHTIKSAFCSECNGKLRYGSAVELINLAQKPKKKRKKRRSKAARKYPAGSARAELAAIAASISHGPTVCRRKFHSGKIRR